MRITIVAICLLTAACASAEVMRLDSVAREPSDPESVHLLLEEPDSPYVAIALIEVSDDGWGLDLEGLRDRLTREAAELGGEAVILSMRSDDAGAVMMPVGDQFWAVPVEEKTLTGQVIIYQR